MAHIMDRLKAAIEAKDNPTVAGIDTRIDYMPENMRKLCTSGESIEKALVEFNREYIDAVCAIVPAVKIQSAYYEMYAHYGVKAFYATAAYALQKGLIVMADVKRSDIGSTAEAYAQAYLNPRGFDMATVNPYLGYDGVKPFVDLCDANDKGIFVLVRTSNPSSSDLQSLRLESGELLYESLANSVEKWNVERLGECGYGSIGAVVGATHREDARHLREIMPHTFFLVPGFGAQGGGADDAAQCFDEKGGGAIVNNSRGLMCAYLKPEYKGMSMRDATAIEALKMKEQLNAALQRR